MSQASIRGFLLSLFFIPVLTVVPFIADGQETLNHRSSEPLPPAAEHPASATAQQQPPIPSTVLAVLPESGRDVFYQAFAAARKKIKIEICVLEDPQILASLQAAIQRGVQARVIVDSGKYNAPGSQEPANLQQYVVSAGGELHLSNPIFPRSFPKIIIVDSSFFLLGSACLDTTTFQAYRDFVHVDRQSNMLSELDRVFENDWTYSAPPGETPPYFNPTPQLKVDNLMVSPVNSAAKLVTFYQNAKKTLDVYTELLGNPTLEGELAAAVNRGVQVRLIAPVSVNGGDDAIQQTQLTSLARLKEAGVAVHVSGPEESFEHPYMHARAAIADGRTAFLGSISLSPNSTTVNREAGFISKNAALAKALAEQFNKDYTALPPW